MLTFAGPSWWKGKSPANTFPFEHVFDPEGNTAADVLIGEIGTRAWSPQELSDDRCFLQKTKRGGRRAVEKAGPWKARKTKSRFSSLPTALGNPAKPAGFPLFPQPRLLLVSLKQNREF